MYSAVRYNVNPGDPLFEFLDGMAHLANNLYNTSLFRIRQVLTGIKKDIRTPTKQSVFDEIDRHILRMNNIRVGTWRRKLGKGQKSELKLFERPSPGKSLLGYNFLEALLKTSENPDYRAMPIHAAQKMVRRAHENVVNFFRALAEWKINPEKFTGRPRFTGYKEKGGKCGFEFSNVECNIKKDGTLKFPGTKLKLPLGNPEMFEGKKLMQVEVVPHHGIFTVILVLDDKKEKKPLISEESRRIIAIDPGIDNVAAISNNIGAPGLLFKGGIIKARNQLYNKKIAMLRSELMRGKKTQKGQAIPATRRLNRLSLEREGFMSTVMHTLARQIIGICLEWRIDTIVFGRNKFWKREANIGRKNNQNFVSIPFDKLRWNLSYLAEREGIRFVEQEESYTSKASFVHRDPIPVYKSPDLEKHRFSGKRQGRFYKVDGRILNADLNGSGNILRKACPDAFDEDEYPVFLKEIKVVPLKGIGAPVDALNRECPGTLIA